MTPKSTEVVAKGPLAQVSTVADPSARMKLAREAMQLVTDERTPRPIPAFMLELPWADDSDEIVERIITQLLASDDPDAFQSADNTQELKKLLGKQITVHDLRVRASDKDGGWGGFLILDVTIEGSADHQVITTGAKQAVARLGRAYLDGQIPGTGTFVEVAAASTGRSAPLGFILEQSF